MNLDRIGKYRIVERIGQGAMGEVFKAHDPLLNRFVAIKTISPTLASDPEFRQRFQREAQSAAQLNHPNIVTIYDFGNDEAGLTYMAMELVEGLDLRESIRRRALGPLLRRLDLMVQLCDGLGFAHARGVVHRDLKPANIHVQPSGQVKILDFGLARLASSEMTKTGTVMGTPHYMSPEQVRGQKADARSDVFSLGAVCYEMVAGTRPFDGRTVPEVLQAIVERDAPPLRAKAPQTPQSVSAVIERALSRDPAARFADAAEMGHAFAAVQKSLAGETIVGAAPGAEATVLQHPGDTGIGHATEGSTALDPRRRSSILRRSLSVTSRQDPTVAAELTHVPAAPSRLPLVAGAAVAVLVAAGIGGYMYVRSRAAATAPAASTAQEQSVLTEALLSGKVELARADLDNKAYDDAVAHAREALVFDPTSAEAKDVLDRALAAKADVEKAVTDARAAVGRGDTAAASEALGRLLALDRRHPAARDLMRDLNRYSRRQAEEARGRAATSRAAAEDASTLRTPAYAQARRLTVEADGLFAQERFAEAADKYIESRDAFDALKREVDAARAAEAARAEAARAEAARAEASRVEAARVAAARPAPTGIPTPTAAPSATATPTAAPTSLPTATPAAATPQPAAAAAAVPAAPGRDPQDPAVRRVIADLGRAFETQDVSLYRAVMGELSADAEKKLRESFKAVKYDRVAIEIESVEVSGEEATARVQRQDTINGRTQPLKRLVYRLARSGASWRIVSMALVKG